MRAWSWPLALLLVVAPVAAEEPFADLAFDAASSRASAEGKLLLVDFTASWCPPCRRMEAETWPAGSVKAWIAEHAIAIQVDIDRDSKLSRSFGIASIPTIVLLKDGKEVARKTGFQAAEPFVRWGADALAGGGAAAAIGDAERALLDSEDCEARLDAALDALGERQFDLALEHVLWLWSHDRLRTPAAAVRHARLLTLMGSLARQHEPAREALLGILHDLELKVFRTDPPVLTIFEDWMRLCDAAGRSERVLSWFDQACDEQGRLYGSRFEQRERGDINMLRILMDNFLVEHERFAEAARLYEDPLRYAQEMGLALRFANTAGTAMTALIVQDPDVEDMMEESMKSMRPMMIGRIHAVVLAAGRTDEARRVAEYLLQDDTEGRGRLALVEQVLDLGLDPSAQLSTWLDEAAGLGADVTELRRRLAD